MGLRRQEWDDLTTRLADTIEVLEDGHYLSLQFRAVPYYVQVAVTVDGLRAEAVSNRFLEGWQRLDVAAIDRLRRLGWRPPTDIGDGPVNWWRHFDHPVHGAEMADLFTSTLNRAFDVARVDQLEYRAFSRSGDIILLPGLGLAREAPRPKPAPLEQRVDAYFKDLLGVDELQRDSDGDIPIRWDDHMVFVRVISDPGYVRVFSPVLHDLEPTRADRRRQRHQPRDPHRPFHGQGRRSTRRCRCRRHSGHRGPTQRGLPRCGLLGYPLRRDLAGPLRWRHLLRRKGRLSRPGCHRAVPVRHIVARPEQGRQRGKGRA